MCGNTEKDSSQNVIYKPNYQITTLESLSYVFLFLSVSKIYIYDEWWTILGLVNVRLFHLLKTSNVRWIGCVLIRHEEQTDICNVWCTLDVSNRQGQWRVLCESIQWNHWIRSNCEATQLYNNHTLLM